MKKILLFIVVSVIFVYNVKAECQYSELRELNSLASHITSSYVYNDANGLFDITINNINNKMYLIYDYQNYVGVNGVSKINSIPEGTNLKIKVISSSESGCVSEHLRTITISIPYINPYYNSSQCYKHEDLTVCNSRFLDYRISYKTFKSLLQNSKVQKNKSEKEQEKDDPDVVIKVTFVEKVFDFIKNNYIKILLIIISSSLSFMVGSKIVRKIKHGI